MTAWLRSVALSSAAVVLGLVGPDMFRAFFVAYPTFVFAAGCTLGFAAMVWMIHWMIFS